MVALVQVYKAVRNGVQTVAVKIFTDQISADHQARYAEAFRREIFILRSCHDRNIVQFLGACLQVQFPAGQLTPVVLDSGDDCLTVARPSCLCLHQLLGGSLTCAAAEGWDILMQELISLSLQRI